MSGSWEKSPLDVLVAMTISGAETQYQEVAESHKNLWMQFPKEMRVGFAKFPEPEISVSRNKAVQAAINSGARWLWFLDSDILPPPDAFAKLVSVDKPIVGGLYVRRHNPPFNEMLRLTPQGLRPIADGEYQPGSLVECDAVATGCLLIRTEVFEKFKPFQVSIDGRPCPPSWFEWTANKLNPGYSEDFQFCLRARESGIPVFCHTAVKLGHMGPMKFYPSGNGQMLFRFPGEPAP